MRFASARAAAILKFVALPTACIASCTNCYIMRRPEIAVGIALHGAELFDIALADGVDLMFEASVAGGIPIIRSLRNGLVANRVESLHGILNGTTNYILTRMTRGEGDYAEILADAQAEGFAEPDPTADVSGADAASKLAILSRIAFEQNDIC